MRFLKVSGLLSASLLVFLAAACGEEDEEAALTGSATYSCTLDTGSFLACTETRNTSEALATAGVEACTSVGGTGAKSACANKDSAPGECAQTSEDGVTTYSYQSGDAITAETAKGACESEGGTFTASE